MHEYASNFTYIHIHIHIHIHLHIHIHIHTCDLCQHAGHERPKLLRKDVGQLVKLAVVDALEDVVESVVWRLCVCVCVCVCV